MSSSSSDDDDLLTSSYVPIAKKRKAKSTTADDERAFAELTESAQGDLEQKVRTVALVLPLLHRFAPAFVGL